MTERFVYFGDDGTRYVGHIVQPDHPNGAAVLIAHGAPGIGKHERLVAARLAAAGYVALAADSHGEGRILGGDEIDARLRAAKEDVTSLRAPLNAALAALRDREGVDPKRIAAIGYCFGGLGVLEFARGGADVAAVVAFHAILPVDMPEEAKAIRASVLVQNATLDPFAPLEMRTTFEHAMNAAGIDWRMILYGNAEHGFTMPDAADFAMSGVAYHALSDQRSWRAMLDHLRETIGPPLSN